MTKFSMKYTLPSLFIAGALLVSACGDDEPTDDNATGGGAGEDGSGGASGGSGGSGGGDNTGGDAGSAGAAGAASYLVDDCASLCEASAGFSCPAGVSPCPDSCTYLTGKCPTELAAYFGCTDGKTHTEDNITCQQGYSVLLSCASEAQTLSACAAAP